MPISFSTRHSAQTTTKWFADYHDPVLDWVANFPEVNAL